MAVKKENVRIWITIHKDTKETIEKLQPLLKARSLGEVVERAVISYALAVSHMYLAQFEREKQEKEKETNEESN